MASFSVSAQHMNDTQLQKPMQVHSGSLPRQTQTDGSITGYYKMLRYENVLVGTSAAGGITAQTSIHSYTADRYKRFHLSIGGDGGITRFNCSPFQKMKKGKIWGQTV